MSHSIHLKKVMNPKELKETAQKVSELIKKYYPKAEYIAVCGSSGSLIAGAVSIISGIPILLVRKTNESCHSYYSVEFQGNKKKNPKYVIIDDFISSGDTIDYIIRTVKSGIIKHLDRAEPNYPKFKLLGLVLYQDWSGQEFLSEKRDGEIYNIAYVRNGID